jgi:hypothetical protein
VTSVLTQSRPQLVLPRAPKSRDELWWLIKALWGVEMPRVRVCGNHVSPFEALAHAFFAEDPGFAIWYASRGSGKSLALAVLGATKNAVLDADVTILGGSMTQSQNVATHIKDLYEKGPHAPVHALKGGTIEKGITATQLTLATGRRIRPIPASQTTVRGPHPPLQLLDEVDEMDEAIYNASLGQAMEQENIHGHTVSDYIVASSTWQNPIGTFTNVIDKARKEGTPIFTWCWRELIKSPQNPSGWMSKEFIDRKRKAVSAEMWRTEYELNEPSGTSRAFDLEAIERYFEVYPTPLREEHAADESDDIWVWQDPESQGEYVVGADWAKESDKTIIVVIRVDIYPRRVVYLRRMNRRPYPVMLRAFDSQRERYNAPGRHDGTGLGNVVHDFLKHDGSEAKKEIMVGRSRSQMFSAYITDFENGGYRLPRNVEMFYRAHRGATVADVFAPHKWNSHTPDDLVAMALAHKEAGRTPEPVGVAEVPMSAKPRDVDAQFHVQPEVAMSQTTGDVTVVDERYDDVAVFDLTF